MSYYDLHQELDIKSDILFELIQDYKNGDSDISFQELEEMMGHLRDLKHLLKEAFINDTKQKILRSLPDSICNECKTTYIQPSEISNNDISSKAFLQKDILTFQFQKYTDKEMMINDIQIGIQNNKNFLTSLTKEYNSTILHCVVYDIYQDTYQSKKKRENIVYFLEFLQDRPELKFLITHKNCKNKTAGETFNHICQYKNHYDYQYISKLLGIRIEKEKYPRKASPKLYQLTSEYHYIQEKLFKLLLNDYFDITSKCKECNKVINISMDLENISRILFLNSNKKEIVKMIKEIITLRKEATKTCEKEEIGTNLSKVRHSFFLDRLEKLLDESEEWFQFR